MGDHPGGELKDAGNSGGVHGCHSGVVEGLGPAALRGKHPHGRLAGGRTQRRKRGSFPRGLIHESGFEMPDEGRALVPAATRRGGNLSIHLCRERRARSSPRVVWPASANGSRTISRVVGARFVGTGWIRDPSPAGRRSRWPVRVETNRLIHPPESGPREPTSACVSSISQSWYVGRVETTHPTPLSSGFEPDGPVRPGWEGTGLFHRGPVANPSREQTLPSRWSTVRRRPRRRVRPWKQEGTSPQKPAVGSRTRHGRSRGTTASPPGSGSNMFSVLARNRTWSATFGGSRAIQHTPRPKGDRSIFLPSLSSHPQGSSCFHDSGFATLHPHSALMAGPGLEPGRPAL